MLKSPRLLLTRPDSGVRAVAAHVPRAPLRCRRARRFRWLRCRASCCSTGTIPRRRSEGAESPCRLNELALCLLAARPAVLSRFTPALYVATSVGLTADCICRRSLLALRFLCVQHVHHRPIGWHTSFRRVGDLLPSSCSTDAPPPAHRARGRSNGEEGSAAARASNGGAWSQNGAAAPPATGAGGAQAMPMEGKADRRGQAAAAGASLAEAAPEAEAAGEGGLRRRRAR